MTDAAQNLLARMLKNSEEVVDTLLEDQDFLDTCVDTVIETSKATAKKAKEMSEVDFDLVDRDQYERDTMADMIDVQFTNMRKISKKLYTSRYQFLKELSSLDEEDYTNLELELLKQSIHIGQKFSHKLMKLTQPKLKDIDWDSLLENNEENGAGCSIFHLPSDEEAAMQH